MSLKSSCSNILSIILLGSMIHSFYFLLLLFSFFVIFNLVDRHTKTQKIWHTKIILWVITSVHMDMSNITFFFPQMGAMSYVTLANGNCILNHDRFNFGLLCHITQIVVDLRVYRVLWDLAEFVGLLKFDLWSFLSLGTSVC